MALGGGTFTSQNKVLPGAYHNFVSASKAFSNLSDRGYVALPIALDWGTDDEVFTLTAEDFQKNSLKLLGYDYANEKLKGLRDVFKNAHTAYIYKLAESAIAATNTFATAINKGVRGNDLKIVITANVDVAEKFDVLTYLGTILVDEQKGVEDATKLVSNDFVTFKQDAVLAVTAGIALAGGLNGAIVTATAHQAALDALEAYGFNVLACLSSETTIKALYVAYTKRLRDEVGAKFQVVGYGLGATDHEGVIDVHNAATELNYGLVYWTVGAAAGCAINKSNTNKLYNGEYTVEFIGAKTQTQLVTLLKTGKFVLHKVGEDTRVLEDVNTLTSFTSEKNEDFSMNQVVRVLDQIAIDTANIFNTRYLGQVPNDKNGRVSFWSDIAKHRKELQSLRAIENYNTESLTVEQGQSKKAIVVAEKVTVTVAMSQLYITTTVA